MMRRLFVVLLLFVSPSGMAQEVEDLKEYVISQWHKFEMPQQDGVEAVLAERRAIAKYIKKQGGNSEAEEENGAQAIRKVVALYDDGQNAGLKVSEIKKLLKGVDL